MTLIAYWVTLRAKSLLGDAESSLGDANISMAGVHQLREVLHQQTLDAAEEASTAGASYSDRLRDEEFAHKENVAVLQRQVCVWGEERERERASGPAGLTREVETPLHSNHPPMRRADSCIPYRATLHSGRAGWAC
jgi:hypothetical protein